MFFADYSQKWIKTVTCTSGFSSCGNEQLFMAGVGGTTRLLVGPDGNIYQLTLDGKISRIAPTGRDRVRSDRSMSSRARRGNAVRTAGNGTAN